MRYSRYRTAERLHIAFGNTGVDLSSAIYMDIENFLDSIEKFMKEVHPNDVIDSLLVRRDFLTSGKFKIRYQKYISKADDKHFAFTYYPMTQKITSP